jgi:hypothetical protein
MKIKEAIEQLQELEKEGVKNIILAYWQAGDFDRKDNKSWVQDVEIIDESFDWSNSHNELSDFLDSLNY